MKIKNKKYKIILILLVSGSLISFFSFLKYLQRVQRPNVLLITIDSLRRDHLGCYGYKRNTSPNIDNLAKEGILFTQAISQGAFLRYQGIEVTQYRWILNLDCDIIFTRTFLL